jgi:hypothetical protein
LPEIDGKELSLIIYHNSKYFVVNSEYPAPEFPKVYVVPDEQVRVAIIGRVRAKPLF